MYNFKIARNHNVSKTQLYINYFSNLDNNQQPKNILNNVRK